MRSSQVLWRDLYAYTFRIYQLDSRKNPLEIYMVGIVGHVNWFPWLKLGNLTDSVSFVWICLWRSFFQDKQSWEEYWKDWKASVSDEKSRGEGVIWAETLANLRESPNGQQTLIYTPGSSNIAIAGQWTRIEDAFPIEMGICQPAMLVYPRVYFFYRLIFDWKKWARVESVNRTKETHVFFRRCPFPPKNDDCGFPRYFNLWHLEDFPIPLRSCAY